MVRFSGTRLRTACARRGISIKTLADSSGVPLITLQRMLEREEARPSTLAKLAAALHETPILVELDEFLVDAEPVLA